MRILSVAGIIFLVIAAVQAGITRRDVDADGFDDEADSQEVTWEDGLWLEDEDGNLVELTDEDDDETVEETEALISERVFFHLFTRSNPETTQELVIGDTETLKNSNWDANKLTRIVTHGWMSSRDSEACTSVRDAYLQSGDHNVVVVDWSKISKRSYGFAARRVRVVGTYIAKMIDFLETQGMDISQLVVVGHSLGGHIAGISSLRATNTVGYVVYGGKAPVEHIILSTTADSVTVKPEGGALDPAGPYFWVSTPGNRVDKDDAANVQVIHTNGGRLGLSGALGDIDFYPNGGSSQPGCTLDITGACAHSRAYKYFAESINSDAGFFGQKCRTWRRWRYGRCGSTETTFMGGDILTDVNDSGSYFFRTASSSQFALGRV